MANLQSLSTNIMGIELIVADAPKDAKMPNDEQKRLLQYSILKELKQVCCNFYKLKLKKLLKDEDVNENKKKMFISMLNDEYHILYKKIKKEMKSIEIPKFIKKRILEDDWTELNFQHNAAELFEHLQIRKMNNLLKEPKVEYKKMFDKC